jgi:hypothetical protein
MSVDALTWMWFKEKVTRKGLKLIQEFIAGGSSLKKTGGKFHT